MKRILSFIKLTLLGGVAVLLPILVLYFIFTWVIELITNIVEPLSVFIQKKMDISAAVSDVFSIILLLMLFFIIGLVIKTRYGRLINRYIEIKFFYKIPGYTTIKDVFNQFFSSKRTAFKDVALVNLFNSDTQVTAFITDYKSGIYTVFVPTGPNPTSGMIYHLPENQIIKTSATVEEGMRSIISCGAGSSKIIGKQEKKLDPSLE